MFVILLPACESVTRRTRRRAEGVMLVPYAPTRFPDQVRRRNFVPLVSSLKTAVQLVSTLKTAVLCSWNDVQSTFAPELFCSPKRQMAEGGDRETCPRKSVEGAILNNMMFYK